MGTEKFDFRTSIRFNERLGRTGTREPVTTTENFLQRFSGLGFLKRDNRESSRLDTDSNGRKTNKRIFKRGAASSKHELIEHSL